MFSKNIFSNTKNFFKYITKIPTKFTTFSLNYIPKYLFSTEVAKERSYGGLKDQDRIFTNIYKDDDPFIDGALRRVIKFN